MNSNGLDFWVQLSLLDQEQRVKIRGQFKKAPRIYLASEDDGLYLTRREAQCAYYLLLNMGRTEIAACLGLSRRTVDTYIETSKKKLGCRSQPELVDLLHKSDFIAQVKFLKLDQDDL